MICKHCMAQIDDEYYYCPNCHSALDKPYKQQPFNSQQPSGTYQPQYQSKMAADFITDSRLNDARTYGILAIVLGFIFPIFGIILGCIGMSKLSEIPNTGVYNYEIEVKKKKTKTLNILGIVLPLVCWIIAIIAIIIIAALSAYFIAAY